MIHGCPCCGGVECVRATTSARVTVGLTVTDRSHRAGELQVPVVLNVPLVWLADKTTEQIAEAMFTGTNHPYRETLDGLAGWVGRNWRGTLRSVSVGDTVTFGDTRLACDHTGWTPA